MSPCRPPAFPGNSANPGPWHARLAVRGRPGCGREGTVPSAFMPGPLLQRPPRGPQPLLTGVQVDLRSPRPRQVPAPNLPAAGGAQAGRELESARPTAPGHLGVLTEAEVGTQGLRLAFKPSPPTPMRPGSGHGPGAAVVQPLLKEPGKGACPLQAQSPAANSLQLVSSQD